MPYKDTKRFRKAFFKWVNLVSSTGRRTNDIHLGRWQLRVSLSRIAFSKFPRMWKATNLRGPAAANSWISQWCFLFGSVPADELQFLPSFVRRPAWSDKKWGFLRYPTLVLLDVLPLSGTIRSPVCRTIMWLERSFAGNRVVLRHPCGRTCWIGKMAY